MAEQINTIVSASEPRWSNPNKTAIDLMVVFAELQDTVGEVPFTARPDDIESHGKELYERAVKGEFGEIAEYPLTDAQQLALAIEQACNRVSSWRSVQENADIAFEYNGRTWDAGKDSKDRIKVMTELTALPDGFFWTDYNNNDVEVDMAYLQKLEVAMNQAMAEQGFKIHARQREMKEELQAMTDIASVNAYIPSWGSK